MDSKFTEKLIFSSTQVTLRSIFSPIMASIFFKEEFHYKILKYIRISKGNVILGFIVLAFCLTQISYSLREKKERETPLRSITYNTSTSSV